VYFELRLLQQAQDTTETIADQLQRTNAYGVVMDGDDQRDEVLRIQRTILSKVQDKDGKPIKFFSNDSDAVNIVVIDASSSIMGMLDVHDCKLALYGDPGVHAAFRQQVFGLFQEDKPDYPQWVHDRTTKYAHVRNTLHGVLFLFRKPDRGVLTYQLHQYLMFNPALIREAEARPLLADIACVIPAWRERPEPDLA